MIVSHHMAGAILTLITEQLLLCSFSVFIVFPIFHQKAILIHLNQFMRFIFNTAYAFQVVFSCTKYPVPVHRRAVSEAHDQPPTTNLNPISIFKPFSRFHWMPSFCPLPQSIKYIPVYLSKTAPRRNTVMIIPPSSDYWIEISN